MMNTKKVLWFSRHEMSQEQAADLARIYGEIGRKAWGYVIYEKPLKIRQIEDYELMPYKELPRVRQVKETSETRIYEANGQQFMVEWGFSIGNEMGAHNDYNTRSMLQVLIDGDWQPVMGLDGSPDLDGDDWDAFFERAEKEITDWAFDILPMDESRRF